MKKYKIKVNGKSFLVEVETVEEIASKLTNEQPTATPKETKTSEPISTTSGEGNEVKAPIAGKVIDIKISVGDKVKKGQTILIIEAMKLENEIKCPFDGTVSSVTVNKGAMVSNKQLLAIVK